MPNKITAIIPTKNRHDELMQIIGSLIEQTQEVDQIVIVDQSDESSLEDIKKNLAKSRKKINLVYIHDKNISGLPQAKNIGVRKSSGRIIFFFDDDMILHKDYIENILEVYKKLPEAAGVGGVQSDKKSLVRAAIRRIFQRGPFCDERIYFALTKSKVTCPIKIGLLSGGLSSFRRDIFEKYLFDENLVGYALGEDADFCFRASKENIFFIYPLAKAVHKKSPLNRYSVKMMFESKICRNAYFYRKNVEKRLINRMAYLWLNSGLFLDSLFFTIRFWSLDAMKGLFSGYRKISNNFENVSFIKNGNFRFKK